MRTAVAIQQNVVGHGRHGYLVPLREDGQIAESYLFAVGRTDAPAGASSDVMKWLAAFVDGFGAPWRNGEDVQALELERRYLIALPKNMLLREAVATADWSQPEPPLAPRELVLNTWRGALVLREDAPELRKAARVGADGIPVTWYPEGPIWKGARTLILVDLDEQDRALAEAATRHALGDWWTASGRSGTYEFGHRGQAQEWDAARGRFFSPGETFERLEQQRSCAADRVGSRFYRASAIFSRRESRSVKTALRARARDSKRSARAEWRAARRESLGDVLAAAIPSKLDEFHRALALSPEGPQRTLRERFPLLVQELVSSVRHLLHELVANRLLGAGWRQRWFGGRRRPAKPRRPSTEDVVIDRMERERLEKTLSPVEADLLDAKEHGMPLTVWAAEQDILLSDAQELWDGLRLRLRDAMS